MMHYGYKSIPFHNYPSIDYEEIIMHIFAIARQIMQIHVFYVVLIQNMHA